jgi:hypothetical protein
MRVLYRIVADVIWMTHLLVVLIVLFGWAVSALWYVYMAVLLGTLLSLLTFRCCFLSKWEYDLRKKIDPSLAYDYFYASYYTYRLTAGRLSPQFLARAGMVFTSVSLVINVYFRFILQL